MRRASFDGNRYIIGNTYAKTYGKTKILKKGGIYRAINTDLKLVLLKAQFVYACKGT